jgi:50S ribosomal subunit-associated GTPase HflX
VPQWRVWNKIDLTGHTPEVEHDGCGSIARLSVSAQTGAGLAALREALRGVVAARGHAVDVAELLESPEAEQPEASLLSH